MKCPNCGAKITITNVSSECCNGNYYDYYCEYFTGRCPNCDKYWKWCDIYKFMESTIPTLIENDDHL